MVVTD